MSKNIKKVTEIKQRILTLQSSILRIRDDLKYADGGAYSQDLERIREYERDIAKLNTELCVLMGIPVDVPVVRNDPVPTTKWYMPTEEERASALVDLYAEQKKKAQKHIGRFARNRTKQQGAYGHNEKYYLVQLSYKEAQELKAKQPAGEMRWDPYVKRWYLNIYMFPGQRFSPGASMEKYVLDSEKNATAAQWSATIQEELKSKPESDRPFTVRVHGTATPKV